MRLPREVLVVVHRPGPESPEVLVLHRSPEQGAYWHGVAGAVEHGESEAEAAVRELCEETGLDAAGQLVDLGRRYAYVLAEQSEWRAAYPPGTDQVTVDCFAVEVVPGWEPTLNEEHDGYRWCSADEAAGLLHWPEPRDVMQWLVTAPLKDGAWREIASADGRLERGELDEEGWFREAASVLVPAYLAAETPWGQSGYTGSAADWERARRPVVDALDRDGTFLDVGCANGLLMESVAAWSGFRIEPYGLEIAPELAALARTRLPQWADRIFVGNVLDWEPPQRFTFIRTNLEYVPRRRRRELVERLLDRCDRLVVGVYKEERDGRRTEELLRSFGIEIAGRTDVPHPTQPQIDYRVLWIDS